MSRSIAQRLVCLASWKVLMQRGPPLQAQHRAPLEQAGGDLLAGSEQRL